MSGQLWTDRVWRNGDDNLATACRPCNQSKRDMPFDEWMARVRLAAEKH